MAADEDAVEFVPVLVLKVVLICLFSFIGPLQTAVLLSLCCMFRSGSNCLDFSMFPDFSKKSFCICISD